MSAASVFAGKGVKVPSHFIKYDVELQVNHLIVGGIPSTPNTIKGWLKSKLDKAVEGGIADAHLAQMVQKTLHDVFPDQQPSLDEIIEALMVNPDAGVNINTFVRIPGTGELAYESRCMKAAFKEGLNSAYPGTDWDGKKDSKGIAPRKGLLRNGVERIFVLGTHIGLGVKEDEISPEPDTGRVWTEERIKHITDVKTGAKVSCLARVHVVHRPTLTFQVAVADDFLSDEAWFRVWDVMEKIGIGADRARGDGQFSLEKWDRTGSTVGEGVTVS